MVRFAQALTDGRPLTPAYADLMTSGKFAVARGRSELSQQVDLVGCGPDIRIVNNQTVFGHTGGASGETTDIGVYPDPGWIAVILSNYGITNVFQSLIPLLDRLITQQAA
jgi:hypothetical protein